MGQNQTATVKLHFFRKSG